MTSIPTRGRIMTSIQPIFAVTPYVCVLNGVATNTIFIIFGLTTSGWKSTIYELEAITLRVQPFVIWIRSYISDRSLVDACPLHQRGDVNNTTFNVYIYYILCSLHHIFLYKSIHVCPIPFANILKNQNMFNYIQ